MCELDKPVYMYMTPKIIDRIKKNHSQILGKCWSSLQFTGQHDVEHIMVCIVKPSSHSEWQYKHKHNHALTQKRIAY